MTVVPGAELVIVMVQMPDVIDGQVGALLEDFVPLAELFVEATR